MLTSLGVESVDARDYWFLPDFVSEEIDDICEQDICDLIPFNNIVIPLLQEIENV